MEKRNYNKLLPIMFLAIVFVIVIRSFMFASYVVDGESMEPTLHDGSLLMVNKFIYEFQEIDRFDIVVFRASEEEDFVKRVIGLPGDELTYINDQLYVNENYIEEAYLSEILEGEDYESFTDSFTLESITGERTVPEGQLFVMGDNRVDSLDSRSFGFISTDQLIGKVGIQYWPIGDLRTTFGK